MRIESHIDYIYNKNNTPIQSYHEKGHQDGTGEEIGWIGRLSILAKDLASNAITAYNVTTKHSNICKNTSTIIESEKSLDTPIINAIISKKVNESVKKVTSKVTYLTQK